MRSVPLWRSDTGCWPDRSDEYQTQAFGLSLYVPLFSGCTWRPDAYQTRSAAAAGVICQFDLANETFSLEAARAALAEAKQNQKYWYGDFYPLSDCLVGSKALVAWQLHRSDLNEGIVVAFRRSECPYPVLQTALRGLKAERTYRLEFIDEKRARTEAKLTGKDLLRQFELRLAKKGTSLLVRYEAE